MENHTRKPHENYTVIEQINYNYPVYVHEVQSQTDKQHYARKRLDFKIWNDWSDALKQKVLAESLERKKLVHPFILPVRDCYNHMEKYTSG